MCPKWFDDIQKSGKNENLVGLIRSELKRTESVIESMKSHGVTNNLSLMDMMFGRFMRRFLRF
jgi:hypothetical protein